MKVVIVGQVCIDHNLSENSAYIGAGGPPIFISKTFSQLPDSTCTIVSLYGEDFVPYLKNISCYPTKPFYKKTLSYENVSKNAKRRQKILFNEQIKLVKITHRLVQILKQADILFFTPLTADYKINYVKKFVKMLRPLTLKIFLPQGYLRKPDSGNNVIERDFREADQLISLFDFIIISNQDLKKSIKPVESWSEKTTVVVTLGDKGAVCVFKKRKIFVSVKKVPTDQIVDSVGSGDIFAAVFGYRYWLTKDVKKSLTLANHIARQCLFSQAKNLRFKID